MARSGAVSCPKRTVVELSSGTITGDVTFQNRGDGAVIILGTEDATEPSIADFENGIRYEARQGEKGSLGDLFQGLTVTNLWAYAPQQACSVVIYHA